MHARIKDPFKIQKKSMDLKVIASEKFIDKLLEVY